MAFCRSVLVYLATSLARARSGATAEVGTCDIAEVWEKVPLSLLGAPRAALASSSSLTGREFWQGLCQIQGLAIAIGGAEF